MNDGPVGHFSPTGPIRPESYSDGRHFDRNRGDDVGMQVDDNRVRARRLDVAGQLDALAIEQRSAGGLDRRGDVGSGDRAEQPAVLAGTRFELDDQLLEVVLDLARVAEVADLSRVARALDLADLLLGALGPGDRCTSGDEEVAAVAVSNLDDVAGEAEARDFAGEDELHCLASVQRAVEV